MVLVVDSSALLAIFQDEPEALQVADLLETSPRNVMSVVNVLEAMIVARSRQGAAAEIALSEVMARARIEPFPATTAQLAIARQAHARFGKGSGHPARLNFGDCFAYALAMDLGAPLLFKGEDFTRTDVLRSV
jgi:ribonuclease VapC